MFVPTPWLHHEGLWPCCNSEAIILYCLGYRAQIIYMWNTNVYYLFCVHWDDLHQWLLKKQPSYWLIEYLKRFIFVCYRNSMHVKWSPWVFFLFSLSSNLCMPAEKLMIIYWVQFFNTAPTPGAPWRCTDGNTLLEWTEKEPKKPSSNRIILTVSCKSYYANVVKVL